MEDLLGSIAQKLRTRNQTLSFAESCTGGLLSSLLTQMPGVSDVFEGCVVTYSNKMKEDVLDVPAHLISTVGAVSTPVALSMAKGVKALTRAHWAVSITGTAGPTGGTNDKPVGTVCFAIVGPGIETTTTKLFDGSRTQVQNASAEFAARWLMENL